MRAPSIVLILIALVIEIGLLAYVVLWRPPSIVLILIALVIQIGLLAYVLWRG
jgi:hypothetical protein